MPYVAVQQLLDPANQKGMQNYWTADFLAELPDEAIDALVEHANAPMSPLTQIILVAGRRRGRPGRRGRDRLRAADGAVEPPPALHVAADPADTEATSPTPARSPPR